MSFAASPYSAAGYASPVRSIVSVPTLTINCGSVVNLSVIVVEAGSFSISDSSSCYFPNDQRNFDISTASVFESVTSLRTFEMPSQTSSLFRPGARITFVGSTQLAIPAIGVIQAHSEIASTSTEYFSGISENYVQFSVLAKTITGLKGGRIQPLDFIVQTKSTLSLKTLTTSNSVFSCPDSTAIMWRSALRIPTVASVYSLSHQDFRGVSRNNANYALQGGSTWDFYGQKVGLAYTASHSSSVAAFISSFSVNLTPTEPDVQVYAFQKPKVIFIRAVT